MAGCSQPTWEETSRVAEGGDPIKNIGNSTGPLGHMDVWYHVSPHPNGRC